MTTDQNLREKKKNSDNSQAERQILEKKKKEKKRSKTLCPSNKSETKRTEKREGTAATRDASRPPPP